jgi:hypothetical protein
MRKLLALLALVGVLPALMAPTGGIPVTVPQYVRTAAEISASVVPISWGYPAGNVLRYGINTTPGTTDMYAAFNAAVTSNVQVTIPPGTYRLSAALTIPQGVIVTGAGMAATPTGVGVLLVCDLAVTPCVTLGGTAASNGGVGLSGVTVARAAGAIPAGSIGVLVQKVYNPTLSYVNSVGHSIGFEFLSDGISSGISAQPDHLFTGDITDAHVVVITWPELRITQSRFGHNGAGDVACTAYMRVSGGSTTNAAGGPNTISVSNTQFNQGGGATCTYWLQFSSQTPASISDIGEWSFSNVHVEALGTAYVNSDATWTNLKRLKLSNDHFNSVLPFLALNSATAVNDWEISNNFFAGSFTLAPAAQFNFVSLANNKFTGAVSITGVSNSTVTSTGNTYAAGLTYAGNLATEVSSGDTITGGSFTDSAASSYKFLTNQAGTVLGSPTGGAKGVNTLNAQGVYVNGSAVNVSAGVVALASFAFAGTGAPTAFSCIRCGATPSAARTGVGTYTITHNLGGSHSVTCTIANGAVPFFIIDTPATNTDAIGIFNQAGAAADPAATASLDCNMYQ